MGGSEALLPRKYDEVARFLGNAKEYSKRPTITNFNVEWLLEQFVSAKTVLVLRLCVAAHMLTAMGVQMTNVSHGPETSKHTFLPPFVLTFTQQLGDLCTAELAQHSSS